MVSGRVCSIAVALQLGLVTAVFAQSALTPAVDPVASDPFLKDAKLG